MSFVTRFAPSPTGPLHLGHAYSALLAQNMARQNNGTLLLRIEDIDQSRCRPEWEQQIYDDLRWLGLNWPTPVLRQSDQTTHYQAAIEKLTQLGLTYPCRCHRRDIQAAAGAPQEGVPQFGPDGRIYPGTCAARQMDHAGPDDVIRLNMTKAVRDLPDLTFLETSETFKGWHTLVAKTLIETVGDIILVRRGMQGSYHLSVVIDDAVQAISHVIRGEDLFETTKIHVLLQHLMGFSTPVYHHHTLMRNEDGKRLAKRDDARAISKYRADGASVADIRALIGLPAQNLTP